ncbi:hypothetical protein JCM3765_001847 [Sporobolomyces pararoseus]
MAHSSTASKSTRSSKNGAQIQKEKEIRLIKIAMAVTSVYMLVELVVGYSFSALVLVADALHMLNDLVALIVQLYADELGGLEREGSKQDTGFTYGFARTAFVANLINGVILVALCLTLGLESLQRLYSPETMDLPPLVIGLGALALLWNIRMYFMFDHSHHHEHSICHPSLFRRRIIHAGVGIHQAGIMTPYSLARSTKHVGRELPSVLASKKHSTGDRSTAVDATDLGHTHVKEPKSALSIHAITDAFGNIAVIADGVISLMFGPKIGKVSGIVKPWRGIGFVDPLASLAVTYFILSHAFPLVTASSYALMQAFDPQRTKEFRQTFQAQDWLPSAVRAQFDVILVDLRIWSLTKEEHIATLKFEIGGRKTGEQPEVSLEDVNAIEQAAKRVMAKANIRREMVTVEVSTSTSFSTFAASSRVSSIRRK